MQRASSQKWQAGAVTTVTCSSPFVIRGSDRRVVPADPSLGAPSCADTGKMMTFR